MDFCPSFPVLYYSSTSVLFRAAMSELFKKSFKVSALFHGAIIVVLILVPLILDFREKKKPHEMITMIDLSTAMLDQPVTTVPVDKIDIPEPPKDIPVPKPKPKRKKIEVSKKKIRREDEPKPKKPQLSPEEIKKLLNAGLKPGKTRPRQADDLPSWYYALVRQAMYDVWQQPGGLSASAGLVTTVSIRVNREGRVLRRKMVKSSGHAIMDESVMTAANTVSQLKALPASFNGKYKDIVVYFELTGGL